MRAASAAKRVASCCRTSARRLASACASDAVLQGSAAICSALFVSSSHAPFLSSMAVASRERSTSNGRGSAAAGWLDVGLTGLL
eukprot:5397125-Prymnesium_polylepis.1